MVISPDPYQGLYDPVNPHYGDSHSSNGVPWQDWFGSSGGLNQMAFVLSNMPFVGDIGYMADRFRSFEDYMRNYGLTWNDIVYPWMAGRQYGGSGAMFGAINFVSHNVDKFYRRIR